MIRAVGEKSDGKCRILVAGPFPEFGLGYFGRDEEYGLKSTGICGTADQRPLVVRVQLENVVIAVKRQEESDLQLTGLTVMGRPCFPDTTFFFTVDSILMTTIQNFDFPIRAF